MTNYNEISKTLFAEALHRALKKEKLTQDALAEKIEKSSVTVAQMFSAKRFTSIPTLICLCNTLKVTPDELLISYLDAPENIEPSKYQKIIHSLNELHPNEINLLYTIMEGIIKNRI
jgi:Helix-turn-helix.